MHLAAFIPVSDREQAIVFYQGTLGLTLVKDLPEQREARFDFAGGELAVYESVGAGQSRHTLAVFVVDDVDAVVERWRERGVVFEEYDLPEIKTERSIAVYGDERVAWFKDPDGNILAVATRLGE